MKLKQGPLARASGLLVIFATIAGLAAPVSMAATPQFLTEFGKTGSGAGQTLLSRGIATDPDTGHVFVADQINARVDEFTPWGEFVKAFGWDVAPGAVAEQQEIRVKAAAGQFKLTFGANTTPDLPFNAGETEVEEALDGLASIPVGGVTVKERKGNANGTTPFIFVVSFEESGTDLPQLAAADGTTPLSGGDPTTSLKVRTLANGSAASAALESCTPASGCQKGAKGAGSGQLATPQGIAVDSAGDIYVVDWENHRVQKFSPEGRFILMFGGKVNKTKEAGSEAERNLCTFASGDECQKGVVGTGNGEFSDWLTASSFISNDSSDAIYVGDKGRIQKFNPGGEYLGNVPDPEGHFTGKTITTLAISPSGRLFVGFNDFESGKPAPEIRNVLQLAPAGTEACTIKVGRPTALATDATGNVYLHAAPVYEDAFEVTTNEFRQYDSSCDQIGVFAKSEFEESTGIGVNGGGDLYVSNRSLNGANSYIRAYGPAPVDYESALPLPPEIEAEYAIAAGPKEATVGARINPKFWPDTTYYVQYGKADCAISACTEQPAPPGTLLTTNAIDGPVETQGVSLSGLQPNTEYHYRFVAVSGGGGPTFGEGQTFYTYEGESPPPDGRVYEKTSPRAKDGGEVGIPRPAGGVTDGVQPQQATPDGAAVSYASATAFGESPESAPASSQYLSKRIGLPDIWATENINPRFEEGFTRDPVVGFSGDLSHAALYVIEPALTPQAPEGWPNLYWRDNGSGELETLATRVPDIGVPKSDYCLFYGGSSADSKKVFFAAKGALIEGDPVKANGFNLYEWSASRPAGEELRLVSVLPDESAAVPAFDTSFGGRDLLSHGCNVVSTLMREAISADGSKAIWSYAGTYAGAKNPLFDRVGNETVQLDHPQGVAGAGGEGSYWDASSDGSKVFFTTVKKLTPDSTAASSEPDLYRYDFDAEEGEELEDLTPNPGEAADVLGVLGASKDGSYAYFVAKGVLDPEPNSEGESASAGANNLYVWHQGNGVRFLAILAETELDSADWSDRPDQQTARVSASGAKLAFLSQRELTGFENTVVGGGGCQLSGSNEGLVASPECPEAFLYDYGADELICASCAPSGARPHGPAVLPSWSTPYEQPRYLSDDGSRFFFETLDRLDPHDANEKRDVYELEEEGVGVCSASSKTFNPQTGYCLYLLSAGQGGDESYFLDASTTGNDAFFSTREKLVFTDEDERYDVYDARIGGAIPSKPIPDCEGEGCRSDGTHPPSPSLPSTPAFVGPGDPSPKRGGCPKGKRQVKKHGRARCVKAKKQKKQKQRRISQERRAAK